MYKAKVDQNSKDDNRCDIHGMAQPDDWVIHDHQWEQRHWLVNIFENCLGRILKSRDLLHKLELSFFGQRKTHEHETDCS